MTNEILLQHRKYIRTEENSDTGLLFLIQLFK